MLTQTVFASLFNASPDSARLIHAAEAIFQELEFVDASISHEHTYLEVTEKLYKRNELGAVSLRRAGAKD